MLNQRAREEKTVTIATALGAFVAALAIGLAVLLAMDWMTDASRAVETGFPWVVGVAALCAASYLVRHRA